MCGEGPTDCLSPLAVRLDAGYEVPSSSMESVLVLTISVKTARDLWSNTNVIAAHDGNWEHCRRRTAGRFVGLLEVTPGEQQQELELALRSISDLDVMIAQARPRRGAAAGSSMVLGSDHVGIVRDVFERLPRQM